MKKAKKARSRRTYIDQFFSRFAVQTASDNEGHKQKQEGLGSLKNFQFSTDFLLMNKKDTYPKEGKAFIDKKETYPEKGKGFL